MGLIFLDIVAIDGPAGAGKSTVARSVARRLKYTFLDTGAMYRAIALGAVRRNIAITDNQGMTEYLNELQLEVFPENEMMRLELNGEDVTEAIRQPEMSKYASDYSVLPKVRELCSRLQREFGEKGGVVCEGRDMGTVVFPDARWKFFLTASVDERARRRCSEEETRGQKSSFKDVLTSIKARDYQDSQRKLAPLKSADDAIDIDTTNMTLEQVIDTIIEHIASK